MVGWVFQWISSVRARLRQRVDLLLELIVLRHQLAVLQRTGTRRPFFRPGERLFWVVLSRWWADWQRSLVIVQPATVLRWRRQGLWLIWGFGSRGRWRGGRPRIRSEIRALIVRMSRENVLWGAPRIHGELLKLGFDVSQATVSRYMPRRSNPPTQSWRTFLRNQALGFGMIGLGDAGRISDQLLTLVRGWIERVVGCATTKVRDGISCRLTEPSWSLQPLRPSRSSNGTDRRAIHGGCTPVGPRRTAQGGDHWTMAGRRLSPYRSRASPRLQLPAFTKFARSYGCRARTGGMVPRRTSRTNADSRAKPDSNLENHSMLASFAGIRVRGPSCEDTHHRTTGLRPE
jgi:hypothetical protein